MRKTFEMSQADLDALLEACRPVPYMIVGGMAPPSPQELANHAWEDLGRRMGFDAMTVLPAEGQGQRFFTAEPLPAGRPGSEEGGR